MSAIPETRRIDRQRRINIPASIAGLYDDGETFEPTVEGSDIVLEPASGEGARTLSAKNRLRLPPTVVEQFGTGNEFAVLSDEGKIVLRPVENVQITL